MSSVRDQLDRDRYKLIADKIMQLLDKIHDTSLSEKRWIWELLQNAKDVPNKFNRVSVKIELYPDRLVFSHNGDHFSVNNLSGLIQQVSSKDSKNQEEQTGKFGTGFITTHLLSRTINVRGVVLNPNTEKFQHFNVTLDRRAKSSEELVPVIADTIRFVEKLDENDLENFPIAENYENRSEEDFYTIFTYALSSDSLSAAQIGLADLVNTLPLTMISLPKLKSIRIIDHTKNTDETYTCNSYIQEESPSYTVMSSTITIDGTAKTSKHYYTYKNDVVALSIEFGKDEDGKTILLDYKNGQPYLLRDFPLIGSDRFYFPFILNGFQFEPTEMRDGLLLNKKEDKAVLNRSIIDVAVDSALKFNDWLLSKDVCNTYILASSREPVPVNTWDEEFAKPWITNLQKNWRTQLLSQNLVETANGNTALQNLRLPDFEDNSYKHDERFYDFVVDFMKTGQLPIKTQLKKWQSVINPEYKSWNANLKYTKTTFLEELASCKSLSGLSDRLGKDEYGTTEWMRNLVDFLIEAEAEKAFSEYAILPDAKGKFHQLADLQLDAKEPIPSSVKAIYDTLLGKDIDSTLLHESLSSCTISGINTFGLKDAIKSINECIDNKLSNYSTYKSNKSLWDRDLAAIMRIVNTIDPTADIDNFGSRMRALIKPLIPTDTVADQIQNLDASFWKTANRFILSMLPRVIGWNFTTLSSFRIGFFNQEKEETEAISWMNLLFALVNEGHLSISKETAIFPDENGTFHPLDKLHFDKLIPVEYKELDKFASNRDWNSELLHTGIVGFENHQPYDIATVYDNLKRTFEKESVTNRKEEIALRAISLIPSSSSAKHNAVAEIYRLAKTIFGNRLPASVEMSNSNGFEWEKFSAYILDAIASKIATSINIENLCNDQSLSIDDAIEYIDDVIEYAESFYDKRYRSIVEEKYGVWVNQHGDFCHFKDTHIDVNIPEALKNMALNKRVNHDFKADLADNRFNFIKYLPSETSISVKDVLAAIDDAVKYYVVQENGSLQQADFTQLVLDLHAWLDTHKDDEQHTPYFVVNHDRLMVGSLTEKETISLIGKLVGSKDKLAAAAELVSKYSAEEIRSLQDKNEALQEENETLKARIAELEKQPKISIGGEENDDLTEEQKEEYSLEARRAVRKQLEFLGYEFSKGIGEHSIVKGVLKENVEYPLVVKSHRSINPIQINPNEWIELSKDNAMLWIYFGNDIAKPVAIRELLRRQDKLTLSFDSDNLVDDERMMRFAQVLRYFKNLHFDIASLAPESVADKYGEYLDFNRKTDRIIEGAGINDTEDNL